MMVLILICSTTIYSLFCSSCVYLLVVLYDVYKKVLYSWHLFGIHICLLFSYLCVLCVLSCFILYLVFSVKIIHHHSNCSFTLYNVYIFMINNFCM